jgi:hypothetical protein
MTHISGSSLLRLLHNEIVLRYCLCYGSDTLILLRCLNDSLTWYLLCPLRYYLSGPSNIQLVLFLDFHILVVVTPTTS